MCWPATEAGFEVWTPNPLLAGPVQPAQWLDLPIAIVASTYYFGGHGLQQWHRTLHAGVHLVEDRLAWPIPNLRFDKQLAGQRKLYSLGRVDPPRGGLHRRGRDIWPAVLQPLSDSSCNIFSLIYPPKHLSRPVKTGLDSSFADV